MPRVLTGPRPPGPRVRPRPPRRPRAVALTTVLLLGVVVLAGAAVLLRHAAGPAPSQPAAGAAGVVHIHGLGINPKDGLLYIATHTGLFRLGVNGALERVGTSYQDLMGFTVVGPDRFLASGHPDLQQMRQQNLPPLLGLLESTDGGRTWQTLSLLGQADFHALRVTHGRVYGWNSNGAFMVSHDGRSWETRSTLALADFAVNPVDLDDVVATTQNGVQRSADGGRTWQRLPGAPGLLLLAWARPEALLAIALNGTVYESADAGATWQARGALPRPPAALIAIGDTLYAATEDGGVYSSSDGGTTWQLRYRAAS